MLFVSQVRPLKQSFCLCQFFNQVLVMGKSSVSDLSEHVFDLIQELFAIDPMLLTSVMPQLEFKLKVNKTHTGTHKIHYISSHCIGEYIFLMSCSKKLNHLLDSQL